MSECYYKHLAQNTIELHLYEFLEHAPISIIHCIVSGRVFF